MIRETAEFIRARAAGGAAVRVRETPYLFLDVGVLVPALNVNSADVVDDLRGLATAGGVARADVGTIRAVEPVSGGHRVVGDHGSVDAQVVVLALGTANLALVPELPSRLEKRQLFVLDLPVDEDRARLPHIVLPVGAGHAYVFVKDFDGDFRLVVGQENLVEDDDHAPVDHLDAVLGAGVADRLPFLRGARTSRILWGMDWTDKHPHIAEHRPGLLTVNLGSAVRACVPAGRAVAAAATTALAAAA